MKSEKEQIKELLTDKISPQDVFSKSTLLSKVDITLLNERYQSKCTSVFKDLQSDKEFPRDLDTQGLFKFNKYEMTDFMEFNQGQAAQSALDFITGLRQYRVQQEQAMTHSEQEVIDAFAQEFDSKMSIDKTMPE